MDAPKNRPADRESVLWRKIPLDELKEMDHLLDSVHRYLVQRDDVRAVPVASFNAAI